MQTILGYVLQKKLDATKCVYGTLKFPSIECFVVNGLKMFDSDFLIRGAVGGHRVVIFL